MSKKQRRKESAVPEEHWKDEPDAHDYSAAADYLSLLVDESTTASLLERLKDASVVRRKAKDLLRAGRLELLPKVNPYVASDLKKVRRRELLSPVLLIRGSFSRDVPLVVADGYHRICASYHLDEDAEIPCRISDLQPESRDKNVG